MNSSPQIRFLGATETVTGSKYLISFQGKRILVDCGLYQGLKNLRLKNWENFPVDPRTIDAVILTHGHIDHSGYLPRLVEQGFRGKIFCTAATLALCRILLPDTAYLQEEEAEFLNRKNVSKHKPALPLFSMRQVEAALKLFVPLGFHEEFTVCEGIRARFLYAGHILGAAMVMLEAGGVKVGFSGDVGRLADPVFRPPEKLPPLDYLIVESTYGNRLHPQTDPKEDLLQAVEETVKRRGIVLIPAFTVGRSQTLLFMLAELKKEGRLPDVPVYLNSPMAQTVTDVFFQFQNLHKLTDKQCLAMRDLVRYVHSVEESKKLNERRTPAIILSASGMATGGRVLHHLKAFAPKSENLILLSGFQAAGTRGRALQEGAREIKIYGELVPVHAQVRTLENLSAHADYQEITTWLASAELKPRRVFVTHGEPEAARALAAHLTAQFHWNCEVPHEAAKYPLNGKGEPL